MVLLLLLVSLAFGARPEPDAIARFRGIAEVYGAVRYFHPDVAPYPTARRSWNEASAQALEAFYRGRPEDDAQVYRRWLPISRTLFPA